MLFLEKVQLRSSLPATLGDKNVVCGMLPLECANTTFSNRALFEKRPKVFLCIRLESEQAARRLKVQTGVPLLADWRCTF